MELIPNVLNLRLFSCGTSKDGDSYLVEWNESEGAIKRTYVGFRKKSAGIVQFATTKNHFLAVGVDSQIILGYGQHKCSDKYWCWGWTYGEHPLFMSAVLVCLTWLSLLIPLLESLQSLPRLRFNQEGNLLAVSVANNGFKVLANADGLGSLRTIEAGSYDAARSPSEMKVVILHPLMTLTHFFIYI